MNNIQFLLVPDRYAARYLRRYLTEQSAYISTVVGTFNELLEYARSAYLLPKADQSWSQKLLDSAIALPDSFWAESIRLYPRESCIALEAALTRLLEGTFPKELTEQISSTEMSGLGERHFKELAQLHAAMDRQLPPSMTTAARLISRPAAPLTRISVHSHDGLQLFKPWQKQLIARLNQDSSASSNHKLSEIMTQAFYHFLPSDSASTYSIRHLAAKLFVPGSCQQPLDDSLQWIAARDYLEEAEVVAGQVQKLLQQNTAIKAEDLALLLPADPRYALAVKDVFALAGIPLSGIGGEINRRDLGREVLFHFLMVMQKPVATMAWAALLTSPFMPWPSPTGHKMAQSVAAGRFNIDHMPVKSGQGRAMLELLRKNLQTATPAELLLELNSFAKLLRQNEEELAEYQQNFSECLAQCRTALQQTTQIDWQQLRRLTTPEVISATQAEPPNREGLAIFQEDAEPWRQVKHLFVLGFNAGHYPQEAGHSSIFTDQDLQALNRNNRLEIATNQEITSKRRQLFKRQLASAAETVTMLFSRKAPSGDTLQVSETMPFITNLFVGIAEAEQVILEMDKSEDRKNMRWLAETAAVIPTPPRTLQITDLDLNTDLLAIWPKSDGSLREQSPSRLANLMTSPLGWLFAWLAIEPLEWQPETMDPATKGTLAHEVFEHLFLPNKPLPTPAEIEARVHGLLHDAIIHNVPFLLTGEWNVERNHLQSDIRKAALRWQELLKTTGIKVIGNEIKLYGSLNGVPLKGFADILLSMPDGRIIVGDYKKSRSDARKKQMEAGYDSQTSIYRIMLEKGRISSKQDVTLPKPIRREHVGVLYYTLNDQVVLTDTSDWLPRDPDIKELGSAIADQAMSVLKARFAEVRSGQVLLNHDGDEKQWQKDGIKLYCLDNSPLLRIFMHNEEVSS